MLRRGERELPEELPRPRLHVAVHGLLLEDLRDPEVEDLRHARLVLERDEDVVRREVAVNDVLASEVGEAHQGLDHQRQKLGERPPLERAEVDAVDVLHHDRENAVPGLA